MLAAQAQNDTQNLEGRELTSDEGATGAGEVVLVDGSNNQKDQESGQTPQKPQNPWVQMLPFILIFVVMYLFLFRGPRKKQQACSSLCGKMIACGRSAGSWAR